MSRIIESFADGISKGYRLIQNGLSKSVIPDPEPPIEPEDPDIPWTPIEPGIPIEPEPEPEPCSITKMGSRFQGSDLLFSKRSPDDYRYESTTFYLTYSKDDGLKQTISWSTDNLEATKAAWDALTLNANGKIAFVFENNAVAPRPARMMSLLVTPPERSYLWMSGISTDLECEPTLVVSEVDEGTIIYKEPVADFIKSYDDNDGTIGDMQGFNFTRRRSLITIYPTEDLPEPEVVEVVYEEVYKSLYHLDFYAYLTDNDGTLDGEPIEQPPVNIFSCMETPVGTPIKMTKEIIPYWVGSNEYDAIFHAKYRINGGEWVRWDTTNGISSAPVQVLFEQLYDPLTGNLLCNDLTTQAFVYNQWEYSLRGVNDDDINFLPSDDLICLEFEASPDSGSIDLVTHWGGGFKIYSKGYKNETMVSGTNNGNDLGLPIVFSTQNTMGGRLGALPFAIEFGDYLEGEFRLLSNGVLIADSDGPRTDNILIEGHPGGWGYKVTIGGGGSRNNTYELYTNITGLGLTQSGIYYEDNVAGNLNMTSFGNKVENLRVNIKHASIEVPTELPSQMTDLYNLFNNSRYLIGSNLVNWDVSRVTNMGSMFEDCEQFNQDISNWNTVNVTDMSYMFEYCEQFNQDISGWNVSSVIYMDSMFDGAEAFNQDLSQWCVRLILEEPDYFDGDSTSWVLPKPVWGTCPRGEAAVIPPEPIDGTGALIFTVTDDSSAAGKINVGIVMDHGGTPWQIYEDDVLICSDTYTDSTKVNTALSPTTATLYITRGGNSTNQFKVFTTSSRLSLFSVESYNYTTSTARHIVIEQFSPTVSRYELENTLGRLEVPSTIPPSVINCNDMFKACTLFNSDISGWDVSNVMDMQGMFYGCKVFNQDLSKWNVAHIKAQPYQFDNLTPEWTLPKPNWGVGIPPVITNSDFAFSMSVGALHPSYNWVSLTLTDYTNYNADYFELWEDDVLICSNSGSSNASISKAGAEVSTSSWNTKITFKEIAGTSHNYRVVLSKPIETLRLSCTEGPLIDITVTAFSSNAATNALETNLAALFLPESLPAFMTSIAWLLSGCQNILTDIKGWDTSNITNMKGLFKNCNNFNQDISNWNVSNVTDMTALFSYCKTFNRDLSSWNVAKIPTKPEEFNPRTDAWTLPQPVWGTTGIVPTPVRNPLNFNMTSTEYGGFYLTIAETVGEWSVLENDVVIHTGTGAIYEMLINNIAAGDVNIKIYGNSDYIKIGYTSSANMDSCTVHDFGNTAPNVRLGLQNVPLTVPSTLPPTLTNLTSMFENTYTFNQDISGWDVSHVTNMRLMFSGCELFNHDIADWDVSHVTDMSGMFAGCRIFNQDISKWSVKQVTSMNAMFRDCAAFNKPIGTWDVSNVSTMVNMFGNTTLFNQPIGNWNVSSVKYMTDMFRLARAFNQDLSGWNVSLIPIAPNDFNQYADQWTLPKPVWGTTGEVVVPTLPVSTIPLTFRSENYIDVDEALIDIHLINPTGVWTLSDVGGVVASSDGTIVSGVTKTVSGNTTVISLRRKGKDIYNYKLLGVIDTVIIQRPLDTENESAEIRVSKFGDGITKHQFNLGDYDLIVPTVLPVYVTTLEGMFKGSTGITAGIKTWDVSNVVNMDNLFNGASSFNEDLSGWDVSSFAAKPTGFDTGASAWVLPKPVWGTTGS